MPTSGSTDFDTQASIIVTEALHICGVLPEGAQANSNQLAESYRSLNMLVKNLQAKAYQIHAIKHGIIFPEHDKVQYKLGASGADHSCNVADFVYTTVRTAYTSGTTLEVTSTTGMAAADFIGVVLTDGTLAWTTIANPGGVVDGDTLTLTAGLASAAAVGNLVYTYTSKILRPLKIISAFSRFMSDLSDTEIKIISLEEYDTLASKTSESSRVNQLYYSPQLSQGLCDVWPEPNDMRNLIYIRYIRPIEDYDADTDKSDLPQEWLLPVTWGLASLLASKYGVPAHDKLYIKQQYEMMLKDTLDWDVESSTSVFFGLWNSNG